MAPSGTNFTIGAISVLPMAFAISGITVASTKLCLPPARYGPFCSTPPVPMMTVVLPARTASRTSIHVSSSVHKLSPASIGRGASCGEGV